MRRALLLFAFLVCFPLAARAQQFGITSFVTPFMEPSAAGQVYPAPPNVGLIANRPTFCSATGQEYYATDATPAAILYYATVAGTSCTWTAVGGPGASGAVSSVFTRTGAVVAASGDYTCAQVTNCNYLPAGADSGGGSNAYVVNPTPAVTAAFGQSFTFTTTHANTGAATMNASGTGVKALRLVRNSALSGGEIADTTGTQNYSAVYDGTEWLLVGSLQAGFAANPAGTLDLRGAYLIAVPSTGTVPNTTAGFTLMGPPGNSSGPNNRGMLNFICVPLASAGCQGSQNSYATLGFDNDNNFLIGGTYADVAIANAFEVFGALSAQSQGTADNFTLSQQNAPAANACNLRGNAPSSSTKNLCFDGKTELLTVNPQKAWVTTDFTDSTDSTLVAITGLSFTMPLGAYNPSFHCSLMFDQATAAVSDAFGIGVITTAPTSVNANGTSFSGTSGAPTSGVLTGLASTTPTAIVTFTPSAITTIWKAELDGTVEYPANATQGTLNFYVSTTTGADNLIVKRGSYCTLF